MRLKSLVLGLLGLSTLSTESIAGTYAALECRINSSNGKAYTTSFNQKRGSRAFLTIEENFLLPGYYFKHLKHRFSPPRRELTEEEIENKCLTRNLSQSMEDCAHGYRLLNAWAGVFNSNLLDPHREGLAVKVKEDASGKIIMFWEDYLTIDAKTLEATAYEYGRGVRSAKKKVAATAKCKSILTSKFASETAKTKLMLVDELRRYLDKNPEVRVDPNIYD